MVPDSQIYQCYHIYQIYGGGSISLKGPVKSTIWISYWEYEKYMGYLLWGFMRPERYGLGMSNSSAHMTPATNNEVWDIISQWNGIGFCW